MDFIFDVWKERRMICRILLHKQTSVLKMASNFFFFFRLSFECGYHLIRLQFATVVNQQTNIFGHLQKVDEVYLRKSLHVENQKKKTCAKNAIKNRLQHCISIRFHKATELNSSAICEKSLQFTINR